MGLGVGERGVSPAVRPLRGALRTGISFGGVRGDYSRVAGE